MPLQIQHHRVIFVEERERDDPLVGSPRRGVLAAGAVDRDRVEEEATAAAVGVKGVQGLVLIVI